MGGLAQATLIATYDYWGYYNITFLGSEVRRPEKTIPRAILLSVLFVSAFYVTMNLASLPSLRDAAVHTAESAVAASAACGGDCAIGIRSVGRTHDGRAGGVDGVRVGVLVAAGVLARALCGGAGRKLFSLAGSGASEAWDSAPFAGGAGAGGVGVLLLLAAAGDHDAGDHADPAAVLPAAVGVMVLRAKRPELERPFRIPLYPLPPLAAMAGFVFILVNRTHALGGLGVAAGIACSGTLIYLWRAKRLGQWPFAVELTLIPPPPIL